VSLAGSCCCAHIPRGRLEPGSGLPHAWQWQRTAGVGKALAEEFLKAGDDVVLCARSGGCLFQQGQVPLGQHTCRATATPSRCPPVKQPTLAGDQLTTTLAELRQRYGETRVNVSANAARV